MHERFDALASVDDEVYALATLVGWSRGDARDGQPAAEDVAGHSSTATRRGLPSPVDAHVTLPVAFGAVASAAGIPVRAAVEGFIYTRLAAIVSAAMRLMPLGQHEGHTLLAEALDASARLSPMKFWRTTVRLAPLRRCSM